MKQSIVCSTWIVAATAPLLVMGFLLPSISQQQQQRQLPQSTGCIEQSTQRGWKTPHWHERERFHRTICMSIDSRGDNGSSSLSSSLSHLLHQLDERDIRYPPTATRNELEALLRKYNEHSYAKARQEPTASFDHEHTATIPSEPETSLPVASRSSRSTERGKAVRLENHRRRDEETRPASLDAQPANAEQDHARHSASPKFLGSQTGQNSSTASQRKRERTRDEDGTKRASSKDDSSDQRKPQRRAARPYKRAALHPTKKSPWTRLLRKSQQSLLSPLASSSIQWEELPKKVGKTTVRVVGRKTRQISRKLADFAATDENGVRDAEYRYVRKDDFIPNSAPPVIIDVSVTPSGNKKIHVQGDSTQEWRPPRSSAFDAGADQPRARQKEKRSPSSRRQKTDGYSSSSPSKDTMRSPLFRSKNPKLILPSCNGEIESGDFSTRPKANSTSRPPPRRRNSEEYDSINNDRRRRIYSPYAAPEQDDRDFLDRLGELFVDTADRIMWGSYDTDDDSNGRKVRQRDSGVQNASTSRATSGNNSSTREVREPKRHWKDRLEERLDSMMGIHQAREFYNRWTDQEKEEKKHDGGFLDQFSVEAGKQSKRGGIYPRKKKKYDKPIWEEEGNLISLLFGRTNSGNSLFFEKVLDQDSGSLVNLFQSVFRSVLLVASYLCRWASVRGALPQPIVVLGLATAGLCAPPRRRIRVLLITLIILRTSGEIVHGYLFGDNGWEEEETEE